MEIFKDDDTGQSFIKPDQDAPILRRLNFAQWVAEGAWNGLTPIMEKISALQYQVDELTRKVEELEGELEDGRK